VLFAVVNMLCKFWPKQQCRGLWLPESDIYYSYTLFVTALVQ